MKNKFFFMLLILLVIIGVFACDLYFIENGKSSPVAELIQFIGLSNDIDWYRLRHESDGKIQRTQMESDFVLLERKYQQVKELREKTMNEQRAILGAIIEKGQIINQDSRQYAEMLQSKRRDFIGRFSEIEKLGQDLIKGFEQMPDEEREQRFQKYDAVLTDAFQQGVQESDVFMVELSQTAKEFEQIVKVKEVQEGCRRIEFCLQTKVREINSIAGKILKSNFRRYLMVLNELHSHAGRVKKEYSILQDTYILNFGQIEEADMQIVHQFRMLVQSSAQVTHESFNDLSGLYGGLNEKRERFLSAVDLNHRRMEMVAHRYIKKMAETAQLIQEYPWGELSDYAVRLKVLVEEEKRSLQQLRDNYLHLKQLSQGLGEENGNFLENVSQIINEEGEEASLFQRISGMDNKGSGTKK